jgi:hypothetical protein
MGDGESHGDTEARVMGDGESHGDTEARVTGEGRGGGDDSGDANESYVYEPGVKDTASPAEREFGGEGWLLVAAIFVAFLVIPGIIYLNAANVIALPFRLAFLALPMIPAVALAVLAVWVTTRE